MSTLYIVHDFSPDSTPLFAAFSRYSSLLADAGIELGPFNSYLCEDVPTHASLWYPRPEGEPLPPHIRGMWETIAGTLDSGKNVLLYTRRLELASHKYFWEHLHERIDRDSHKSEVLFVSGRPALLLEQYFRANPNAGTSPFTPVYRDWLRDMAKIAPLVQELSGAARIEYLFNASESAADFLKPDILAQALVFLGLPRPSLLSGDESVAGLKSAQFRRIFRTLEVRHNAWPALDRKHCRELLLRLDRKLPEDWQAPLGLRQEVARELAPVQTTLEGACGLAPGALAPPTAFVTEPEVDSDLPLSPELVRDFVTALSPQEREALKARLVNDRPLLSSDQQTLLAELSRPEEFTTLGDAEPPVELTVLTMTYNHENYIAECMDSVLAQKTNFPVRHLVLDHCSPDGTAAIVAEYARNYPSIQPILLSHRVPHENITGLFLRCRTKYAALCDGDDYFTEPTKLQKQVDMLEANPGLAVSFHPVAAVFDDGRPPVIFPPLSNMPQRSRQEFYLADLMNCNFIQTNSVVYRWRFRDGLPDWFRADLCPGDFYWHMLHAETGKIGFIPEVMSVYRRHGAAVYANAFVSSLELRRDHGLKELEAYSAYNEHFGNRYFRSLSRLAMGVFADFLQISLTENDDWLFSTAMKKYPEFANVFLNVLKQQKQASRAKQPGCGRL